LRALRIEIPAALLVRQRASPLRRSMAPNMDLVSSEQQVLSTATPRVSDRRNPNVAAFFSHNDTGHMNPVLGLSEALTSAGWEVHFYAPKVVRERIEGAGAIWRHLGDDDLDIQECAKGIVHELGFETPKEMFNLPFFVLPATLRLLPYLLESVSQLKPRFVAHDAAAPWGSVLAQVLKLPAVSSMSALPMSMAERNTASTRFSPEAQQIMEAAVLAISEAFQVEIDRNHSYQNYAPYTVVTTSRSWHAGHDEFPQDQFHYWGPIASSRKGVASMEGEDAVTQILADNLRAGSDRPLVYCSMGTVVTGSAFAKFGPLVQDFYVKFLRAASQMPHVVFIVAVGKSTELAEEDRAGRKYVTHLFGEPVPTNVAVARSVDQISILQRAAVFVTHCGQNSCNEAIQAGLPTLSVPQFGDQIDNARRFRELGCGLVNCYLPSLETTVDQEPNLELVSSTSLVHDLRALLEEPRFRQASQALSARQEAETGQPIAEKLASLLAYVDSPAARAEKI